MAPIPNYQSYHVQTSSDEEVGKKIKRELDASADQNQRPVTQETLNTITPCAACKLLRRRCAQECPFSPYFSPYEPHKFAYVHRVFGASNVAKMLMEVPEDQRADTASSLVYEATLRLKDPVYGSVGAISALLHQVQTLEAELNAARAEVIKYSCRQARTVARPPPLPPRDHNLVTSSRPCSMAVSPSLPATSTSSSGFLQASTNENDLYFR